MRQEFDQNNLSNTGSGLLSRPGRIMLPPRVFHNYRKRLPRSAIFFFPFSYFPLIVTFIAPLLCAMRNNLNNHAANEQFYTLFTFRTIGGSSCFGPSALQPLVALWATFVNHIVTQNQIHLRKLLTQIIYCNHRLSQAKGRLCNLHVKSRD